MDDFYFQLVASRDENIARLLHESLAASIDRAEPIQAHENIDCDFARLDGHLFHAPGVQREELRKELDACRNRA